MSSEPKALEVPTKVAQAYWDEHAFRGHRLYAELLGNTSTSGLIVLALTGRRLTADECAFVDEIFVALTFADPRIWPLKITRIVGAYGRFLPAFATGYMSIDIDGECIGPGVCTVIAEHLQQVCERVHGRVDDVEAVAEALQDRLTQKARLQGFGVPFRPHDERVSALRRCLVARGRDRGTYWRLLESMAAVVRREKKLEPNIGVALAAVVLDLGFDSHTLRALTLTSVMATFLANAVEAAAEPAASLRVMPLDRVEYVGRPPRESPRRAQHERG